MTLDKVQINTDSLTSSKVLSQDQRSDIAEIIYIKQAKGLTLNNSQILISKSRGEKYQIAPFIKNQGISLLNLTIINSTLSIQDDSNYIQTNVTVDCQSYDIWKNNSIGSPLISFVNGTVLSSANKFSNQRFSQGSGVFSLLNANFSDQNSIYLNLSSSQSTIMDCTSCGTIDVKNMRVQNSSACDSLSALFKITSVTGNVTFQNISSQSSSVRSTQYLLQISSQLKKDVDLNISNVILKDEGATFETGFLWIDSGSYVRNLQIRDLQLYKNEYLSTVVKGSALKNVVVNSFNVTFASSMKSQGMFENSQLGLFNITGFRSLTVQKFNLTCSNQLLDQIQTLISQGLYSQKIYSSIFRVEGDPLGQQIIQCNLSQTTLSGCDSYQILLDQIRINNCYNFENGVLLQCTNCQNFTMTNSYFNQISKQPEYNGGRSGLIQLDNKLVNFKVDGCTFFNIVSEGNMLTEIYQLIGVILIQKSTFTNITSNYKNGGIIAVPYKELDSQRMRINEISYWRTQVKDTSLQINYCYFYNISSKMDGSIIYQVQYFLRNVTLYHSIFQNVTSLKAGAILKQAGRSYHLSYFYNITVLQCFSYGGATFDFDTQSYGSSFFNSVFQCFLPNSNVLTNPLQKIKTLSAIPGPVIRIKQYRSYFFYQNIIVSNCVTLIGGAFITVGEYVGSSSDGLNPLSTVILSSKFYNNSANYGGAISVSQGDIFLQETTFINHTAIVGGVVYLQAPVSASSFISLTVTNCQAYLKGGFISYVKSKISKVNTTATSYHKFMNSVYKNTSAIYGGALSYEADLITIDVNNCTFIQTRAELYGGSMYIYDVYAAYLAYSSFSQPSAKLGAIQYAILKGEDFSMHHYLTIDCNYQETNNLFHLSGVYLTSYQAKVRNCNVINQGSLYHISDANDINFKSNEFSNNIGTLGGVFRTQRVILYFNYNTFTNNSAINGGVVYGTENTWIQDIGGNFTNNKAQNKGGAIYLSFNPEIRFYNSTCDSNRAYEGSCIYIAHSDQRISRQSNMPIRLTNLTATNNIAYKNTISYVMVYASMSGCTFQDNFANYSTNGIYAIHTILWITNSKFITSDSKLDQLSLKTQGGYINALFGVLVDSYQSSFYNGRARIGGAIYLGLKAIPFIQYSTFKSNQAVNGGGAIYMDSVQSCSKQKCQYSNSYFENNLSDGRGDEIFLIRSLKDFKFENLTINNTKGSQLIYAEQVNLTIRNLSMFGNQSKYQKNGAAMVFWNCLQIIIKQSSFANFSGVKGGAIYFYEAESYRNQAQILRSWTQILQHIIMNSTFTDCRADRGGAIYLDNSLAMNISNSTFIANQAVNLLNQTNSAYGGSIYFTSLGVSNITQLYLESTNIFSNNRAEFAGGIIFWDRYEPYIYSYNTSIIKLNKIYKSSVIDSFHQNNSAGFYGSEFASYFQKLKFISVQESLNSDERRLASDGVYELDEFNAYFSNFQSGGELPSFQIGITDIYDQILTLDNTSTIQIVPNSSFNSDPNILLYPPVVEGMNTFEAVNGLITVEGTYFYADPGFNHRIEIVSKYIDLDQESSQELMQENELQDLSYRIKIELRGCQIGEQFTPAGKCEICKENTFALTVQTSPGVCQKCPESAICDGGYSIGPKANFWRPSNTSSYFIKCPYTDACLGKEEQESQNQGPCALGYRGIMCSDCIEGYYKSEIEGCLQCPNLTISIVRLIGFFIAWVFLVVLLVRMQLSTFEDHRRQSNKVKYVNALISHFQFLMVSTSINFVWPDMHLKTLLFAARSVALINIQFLKMDCLIKLSDFDSEIVNRLSSIQTIIIALLPIIFTLLAVGAWLSVFTFHKQEQIQLKKNILMSFAMIAYLYHPSVIYQTSQNFNYKKVNGEERVKSDLEISKLSNQHLFVSYYFAWPSFLLWGLLSPALVLFFINKDNKQKGKQRRTHSAFDLISSNCQEEYNYLEPAKLVLKAGMLLVFILTIDFGVVAQGIIFLAIYYMYFHFIVSRKPFSRKEFLVLEVSSLIVQILTIYLGLYLVTDKSQDWILQNQDQEAQSVPLGSRGRSLFVNLTLIVNYSFFGVWIIYFSLSLKKYFFAKLKNQYLQVSSSLNRRSQQITNEQVVPQNQEDQQDFLLEFYQMTAKIEDLYENKVIYFNSARIKKLKQHLNHKSISKFLKKKERISCNENIDQIERGLKKENLKISFKFRINKKKRIKSPIKLQEIEDSQPQNRALNS